MAFRIKTRDEILQDMIANYTAEHPEVTDFVEGSVIRTWLEAQATALEEVYTAMYLGFRRALSDIPNNVFNLQRKEGVRARAFLTFTKSEANAHVVTVPTGTSVSSASGLTFDTTAALTIASGTSTGQVEAQAEEIGRKYNLVAGTLTNLGTAVDGISTVTNTAATGGTDKETELEYIQRFTRYVEGLAEGNKAGIEAVAMSVDGVTDARIYDILPSTILAQNDNKHTNAVLVLDDGTPTSVDDTVVSRVNSILEGTEDNPGYRPAGISLWVTKATVFTQPLTIDLGVRTGFTAASVQAALTRKLQNRINALKIGTPLITADVYAISRLTPGVDTVQVTVPNVAQIGAKTALQGTVGQPGAIEIGRVIRAGTITYT